MLFRSDRIEIYNPADPADLENLTAVAAVADELSTALPGTAFYRHITPWLRRGFEREPGRRRYIYTAENDNYAAEKLSEALGDGFPETYCLNTVIGKMSKVFAGGEAEDLPCLCPGCDRGHLVEAFNRIFISSAPGIAERRCGGLHVKTELLPFEEAKLFGHNAVHFLLGWEASKLGLKYMSELSSHPDLLDYGRKAFEDESGTALCRKWQGGDAMFQEDNFRIYVTELLVRMTNPFLGDAVDRIIRDLPRKLSCDDRVMGTIRLCLEQGVVPGRFISLASECLACLNPDAQSCCH